MQMTRDIQDALISLDLDDENCVAIARFKFDDALPLFAGHFPGDPIVPGVHQIELVRATVEKLLSVKLRIREVPSAKFTQKVVPSQTGSVRITELDDSGSIRVKATVETDNEVAAKIRLVLERDENDTKDGHH